MRTLLLMIACSAAYTIVGPVQSHDLATQQAPLADHNSETLLLKDAPATIVRNTSPDVARARMLAQEQQRARELYAQLSESLRLNEAQVDELTRLIAEHNVLSTSWSVDGLRYHHHHSPKAEDHELARERMLRVEELLGQGGFAQFTAYKETLYERFQLQKLVRLLAVVGHALSAEQTEQLVSIMVAERHHRDPAITNYPSGTREYAEELVGRMNDFDRHVLSLFTPVLSSDQLDFATKHFAGRAQRRNEALDRYRRSLSEGDHSAGFLYLEPN
jgi:hypothetical protein